MTTRRIEQGPGFRKLGTSAASDSRIAKRRELNRIMVYTEVGVPGSVLIGIRLEADTGREVRVINLTSIAAIEIAKGILQNLAPIHLAADDELMAILKTAEADAAREGEAIQRCLQERRGPSDAKAKTS